MAIGSQDINMEIQISAEQNSLIEEAAALSGQPVAAFTVSAAIDAARRMVKGQAVHADAADFLARADRLDKLGKTDTALDIIYDQVDEMLLAGRFEDVNRCLRDVKTDSYSVHVLLALLTITLAAKRKLPDRAGFYVRAADTLSMRGELEEGLLVGLD